MRYLLTLPEQVAKNTADIAELKEKDKEELWTDECVDIFAHVLAHARFQDDEGVEKAKDLIESLGGEWPGPSYFHVTIPTVEGVDTLTITDADDVEIVDGDLILDGTEITVRELTLLDGYHVVSFTYEMLEEEHDALIDSPIEVTGDIEFKLEIEADDTELQLTDDGDENVLLLRQALAEAKDKEGDERIVKLVTGSYPVNDEIYVDGATLDLNGSTLTFNDHITEITRPAVGKTNNHIYLWGAQPTLINGTIKGCYEKGRGEDGYVPIEDGITPASKGVSIGACSGYHIENVTFNNISGYAIASEPAYWDEDRGLGWATASPATEPAYGEVRFNLTHGTKYVAFRSGIGNNHIISDGAMTIKWSNGEVKNNYVPGDYVSIPSDVTYADVVYVGDYRPFLCVESDWHHMGEIKDCNFECNQRLGIANLPAQFGCDNCTSNSNGFPRVDHTGLTVDSTTSGFMDIEDTQPNTMLILGGSSTNENLGIMLAAAYNAQIQNFDGDVRLRNVQGIAVVQCGKVIFETGDAFFNTYLEDTPIDNLVVLETKDRTLATTVTDCPVLPGNGTSQKSINRIVNQTLETGYGASSGFTEVRGSIVNSTITLNADWINSHKYVDLTFDHCDIISNGHKIINQLLTSGTRRIVFDHCTADVEFNELVNNTDWIEVIVLDDTLDDEWGNTTNQLTDSWGNNENLTDEWRN